MTKRLSHLDLLESESIHILRETAAQFERPALLFSGGKDSIALLHLSVKAFAPASIPWPLLHIDTGHNFPETLRYRDAAVERTGARLITRFVEKTIDGGRAVEEKGKFPSRNAIQAVTLLEAIEEFRFDACIGGGRRDEEKARAKERVFSIRDTFGQWEPRLQRPELWNIYNGRIAVGENVRVFPLSNWTELDVWEYLGREAVALPEIYFSHRRSCILRDGQWFPVSPFITIDAGDTVEERRVRFRTIGDMTCTAAVESEADSIASIVSEIAVARITERGARLDDKRSEAAMEDRKRQGYF